MKWYRFHRRTATAIKLGMLAGSFITLIGYSSLSIADAPSQAAQKPPTAPEMRLQGDRVVLPIVMVREFPFVEGSVAGVSGKLMLDTGFRKALAINDRRIPVVNPVANGSGSFGSGQTYASRIIPVVEDIVVADLRYKRVTQVQSQDATLLEGITPDFLGFLGHDFYEGYALKLDYKNLQATFYRGSSEVYFQGEKKVGALPFELRKLPNIPVMKGKLGDIEATVAFDSGQHGMLYTDVTTKARMIQEGLLKHAGNDEKYDISVLELEGKIFKDLKAINVVVTPFPAAAPTGLHDKTLLTLGFIFLNKYKTVWDYQKKIIYVLER